MIWNSWSIAVALATASSVAGPTPRASDIGREIALVQMRPVNENDCGNCRSDLSSIGEERVLLHKWCGAGRT